MWKERAELGLVRLFLSGFFQIIDALALVVRSCCEKPRRLRLKHQKKRYSLHKGRLNNHAARSEPLGGGFTIIATNLHQL